jgi:hypothetical protein
MFGLVRKLGDRIEAATTSAMKIPSGPERWRKSERSKLGCSHDL